MGPRPYTGRGLKGNDISLAPAFRIPLRVPDAAAHLAPLAGRGQPGKTENQNSARVRGPLHDSERLRLAERPPHPDLLHSPSKTDVNALVARGEKELRGPVSLTCDQLPAKCLRRDDLRLSLLTPAISLPPFAW